MVELIPFGLLVFIGWYFGARSERRHLKRLTHGEANFADMLVTEIKTYPGGAIPERGSCLVQGHVVIANDYLKMLYAGFVALFGGEMNSYRSLMTRARREATLRMLDEARHMGYDAVCNVRMDFAAIAQNSFSVLVTGSAYARPHDGS